MKRCSKCGEEKVLTEFPKNKGDKKHGLSWWCKECHRQHTRQAVANASPEEKSAMAKKLAERRKGDYSRHKDDPEWMDKQKSRQKEYRNRNEINKTKHKLRNRFLAAMKGIGFKKSKKTEEILGCTFEDLWRYLGERPGENYHVDHICPLAQANTVDEVEKLGHFSNLRWTYATENRVKQARKTKSGEILCRMLLGREWIANLK